MCSADGGGGGGFFVIEGEAGRAKALEGRRELSSEGEALRKCCLALAVALVLLSFLLAATVFG